MSDERSRDFEVATAVLGTVSTLLDTVDWEWLRDQVRRAETLGPILDPTAFNAALHSGRLDRNRRAITATATYLAELRAIESKASV